MIRRMKHRTYVRRRVEELRMEVLNLSLRFPYSQTAGDMLDFKARMLRRYEEKLLCL